MPLRFCARMLALCLPLIFIASQVLAAAPQNAGDDRIAALAIEGGRDTFRQFCAPCHGVDGKGRGPIAAVLTTPPSDVTQEKRQNRGAFPLAALEAMLTGKVRLQTPAHGSEQMPIWGATFRAIDSSPTLARARVANLLAYLESIQQ